MAVIRSITAEELRTVLGADPAQQKRVESIHAAACARVKRYARDAPIEIQNEAVILLSGWLWQASAQRRSVFPTDGEGCTGQRQSSVSPIRRARAFVVLASTAGGGVPMIWPWKSAPVEHRASSYTDQVVTAILQAASGGGARPALATAALESAARLYASTLSSCAISGPSSVTRAFDADWRASVASELIRRGQALYVVNADPVSGLSLAPAASWDVYGGPIASSWVYRVQRAGPSGMSWETHPAGGVLCLRWQTDPTRPWAGVSPLQHASDTGSLSGWIEKRLSEEASGPTGAFLPIAKFDADPGADLDGDADDPLAMLRRDIGSAKGQTLIVESSMSAADSPASAPRRDFQVARFGADPPRDLVELRHQVTLDVGRACGIPAALFDATASGQSAREGWRQFISTSIDGLARRIEAQISTQLGVTVAIDTAPLGGRDLAGRASAFARLIKGGLTVDDARQAAGI